MNRFAAIPVAGALLLTGCIRPHYSRPEVPVPPSYRGLTASDTKPGGDTAELRWRDVIRDDRLNELIREALANNYDVKIAAARVLEAAAQAAGARSQRWPSLDAQAAYNNLRTSQDGSGGSLPPGSPTESGFARIYSVLSWELDVWGRIRNASAAARANLLASEEARRTVIQTLAGAVAQTYFLLRDLDLEKEITARSLKSRQESLELVQLRVANGYSSEIDLRQAEVLVKTARASLAVLELQIEQTENALCLLLGRIPGPIARGRSLLDQNVTLPLKPGLPSTLLERRPDIRQAEQELISSHAQVAVAKAAFFPIISLTASTGFESAALTRILKLANGTWLFTAAGDLPIFRAGRIRASVRGAQARREQAVLNYQKTVIQAFREVSDALAATRRTTELRKEQESLVESLRNAVELADLRYRGGVSSYLEYLDSERELLDGELRLIQIRRDEVSSTITLFRGLGGGWQSS